MSTTFEKALAFTLKWEGGYVNDPRDKGGATNKGITQRTYSHYLSLNKLYQKDVKDITDDEVEEVYKSLYWNYIDGETRDPKLQIAAFDFAVNSGVSRSIAYIRRYKTLDTFLNAREDFLKSLANAPTYIKGWLNRVEALRSYLSTMQ